MSSTFWFACVPTRLLLATVIWFAPQNILNIFGWVALLGVAGFVWRMATFDRNQTQLSKPVDWNHIRPLHIITWLVFAVLVFSKSNAARYIPFIDVLIGVVFHGMLR